MECNKKAEEPVCKICGRKASEIHECVCNPDDVAPDVYAREDGTYNPFTNQFICTTCYIKIGMPLGMA